MGEIADMMLDGTLCVECGVYIESDNNSDIPRHCEDCRPQKNKAEGVCKYCKSTNLYTEKKGQHIGLYCKECKKWIKWLPQEIENWRKFEMPYGKYKGETLGYLAENHPNYIKWLSENSSSSIKKRALLALGEL